MMTSNASLVKLTNLGFLNVLLYVAPSYLTAIFLTALCVVYTFSP